MNYLSVHRTVKAPNLTENLPLDLVPKNTFSEIPWTFSMGWTPKRPSGFPCAEWFRRDDERKAQRAKEKMQLLLSKKREEAR